MAPIFVFFLGGLGSGKALTTMHILPLLIEHLNKCTTIAAKLNEQEEAATTTTTTAAAKYTKKALTPKTCLIFTAYIDRKAVIHKSPIKDLQVFAD